MAKLKKYILENLEQILVLVVILSVICLNYYFVEKLALLNLLYIPSLIAGLLYGVRKALLTSIFSVVAVLFFMILYMDSFSSDLSVFSYYVTIIAWGSFLILSSIFVGYMHEKDEKKIAQLTNINREKEEILSKYKKSDEQYRLLADHMRDTVWIVDLDLNIIYMSPSAVKLLGWTLEEAKQLRLDQLLTLPSFKAAMDFYSVDLAEAIAAPPDYILNRTLELEFRCKNGKTVWVESMFSIIRDENGKPVSILGESREITRRKQIEESLRISERNFRNSIDESPFGIRISAVNGETVYANRAMLEIYGYDSIEEFKKTPITERYTPESYIQWQERKKIREKGEIGPSEYEVSIVKKTGGIRHLHVSRSFIYWNGQKQYQVIYQDITLRKQTEEKFRKTVADLRQSISTTIQVLGMASEAKDPYTAGHHNRVSHLAYDISREMALPRHVNEGVRMAGSIHDLGKISVPAEILSKPTRLDNLEFMLVQEHAKIGYEMLKNVDSPWPLAEMVYQHHERMNGTGYPRHLKGNEIIMGARIMAVADVVEAMSSHRPYRPSLGIEAALEEIEKNKGTLYDISVVNACLRLFREKGYRLP